MIPGPDDGKVAVERAKVEGMEDFLQGLIRIPGIGFAIKLSLMVRSNRIVIVLTIVFMWYSLRV